MKANILHLFSYLILMSLTIHAPIFTQELKTIASAAGVKYGSHNYLAYVNKILNDFPDAVYAHA